MDNRDKEVAVKNGVAAVDEVQVVAEPLVDGLDSNNLKRAGRATNGKVGKQTPTHTSEHFQ